ncbi:MAG: thiamine pyrophosphate-dependent enzyme [Thermomicrobiales bacterium]
MPKLTGGQALVQSIKSYGVDTIFGLPGVQLDNTFDALYDEQDNIRVINTRHEQSTAYMAYGYAVRRPGRLASISSCRDRACSTRRPPSRPPTQRIRRFGALRSGSLGRDQPGFGSCTRSRNQLETISLLTKWAARIEKPADTPAMVREAFKQLRTGRRRPVELEMSPDIMGLAEEVELLDPVTSYPTPEADPDLVASAAELLANAKNPIIFAGGGAMDAGEPIRELAEVLQAPVIMTPNGRGTISDRHPMALTMLGGRHVYEDADVVLAIGTRFDRPATDWGTDDGMKIIRVDIDDQEIDRIIQPDISLLGDANAVLGQIFDQVDRKTYTRDSRAPELNEIREAVEDQLFEFQPSHDFAKAIREELPDDGILSGEITQLSAYADIGFPVYRPRSLIGAGYQGTLGFGYATALGVQVGNPDRKVVSINGDGGFLYTMPELATAVRHQIPLVAIVINDGAFGNVKYIQQTRYGGREIASTLGNPDFVKLAESFGAAGLRATNAEELGRAVREGFENNHPTLIDVPVDRLPPIRMITRGRIRG